MYERPDRVEGFGRDRRQVAALFFVATLAWLLVWIFRLGDTLINDEYAALDYFYRVVRGGAFYPTPDKLHKPLSVAFGVFAWWFESPLAYEVLVAVFGAGFVALLYLALEAEFGRARAVVAALITAAHPDLMYYVAQGSTVVPFAALATLGLIAARRRDESGKWLYVYAACFFLGGLLRPEAWLFGGPALVWWSPWKKGRRAWLELSVALFIIGLGPLLWFGKDYFINGDFLHGIHVATRDKLVGTGAPLSALDDLAFFWTRIVFNLSAPVTVLGWVGLLAFIFRKGPIKGLLDPFAVFPLLVAGYVWLIVYLGVWHAQRYWYFDSVFTLIFAVDLAFRLADRITASRAETVPRALFFVGLIPALALTLERPEGSPPDLRWLLLAAAFFALAAAMLLLWPRSFFAGWTEAWRGGWRKVAAAAKSPAIVALLVLSGLGLAMASTRSYILKHEELALEAKRQQEMVAAAAILRERIPPGAPDRILIPSRRNEQLNWLFRDREVLDAFFFGEAFYLDYFKHVKFYQLHPDWIVYLPHDFQFPGPDDAFLWLEYQDHAELQGISIDLVADLGEIRIFKVTYPPGHPPKQPLPPIP